MIKLFSVPITQSTRQQGAKDFVRYAMEKKGAFYTATPNAEILLEAEKNPDLKKFLKSCVLNFPDSVSLRWAAEYQTKKWSKIRAILELLFLSWRKNKWKTIPQRVCGSDIFEDICREASEKNINLFLLGGLHGVASKTKELLEKKYPKIKIVGTSEGSPKDDELVKQIANTKPQIIFVAYGCPTQEFWIAQNLKKIPTARIAMGIGGTFDFMAGHIPRAPKFMQKLGLEWLYRLIKQPSRAGRIWKAVVVFPWKVLSQ